MELVPPTMAFDHASTGSSASPNRSRSILSKLSNRFGKGNRSISEFHIEPDDPWKTYSPDDIVTGSVTLTITKPTRITHLVVCLHGYVKVFKNPVAPGESAADSGYLGPGRGSRGEEYLGNGFATLFEDEVVLCGDGRLKEGVYKFRFELRFPSYSLPSSIHFERGTISYVITSTLTRPTTIAPTLSCDKRLILLESIDIQPLPPPKPKVISLEPISRKKSKSVKAKSISGDHTSSGTRHVDQGPDSRPSPSPVPSEHSNSSCVTDSTQSFQVVSEAGSARCTSTTPRNDENQGLSSTRSGGMITATTKLLRAGALPGDVLPIHVSVKHTKPIRSPHGIIITLYRQGRIDMYPAIPIGVPQKGKKPVYEDYYPKSRTGLGGLSFVATRSNCVFRKDLSQSFSPLIIDPVTMKAEVKTSIRIPEDSFPTITRVPGGMISFRYYVEVVMDLGGKLAAQDRFLFPRLNMVNATSNFPPNGRAVNTTDKGRGMVSTDFAGNVVDTDQVRREKSVAACVFEVLIGSQDSARRTRQSRDDSASPVESPPAQPQQQQQTSQENGEPEQQQQQHPPYQFQYHEYNTTQDWYPMDDGYGWEDQQHPYSFPAQPPGQFVPPPQPDEVVDEKTRLRRAEEMLLPSEPPPSDDVASSSAAPQPSAPTTLPEHHSYHHPVPMYNSDPEHTYSHDNTPVPSARSVDTLTADQQNYDGPSSSHAHSQPAPQYSGPAPNIVPNRHDKQEVERQRLLHQASAPPDGQASENESHSHDLDDGAPNAPNAPNGNMASAPALTEEDIVNQEPSAGESLPRYQR